MEKVKVSREDWEAMAEMVNAKYQRDPDYGSSKMWMEFTLECGVVVRLNGVALVQESGKWFYGRADEGGRGDKRGWTVVEVDTYQGSAMNFFGKGSRSNGAHDEAQEILNTLTGVDGSL